MTDREYVESKWHHIWSYYGARLLELHINYEIKFTGRTKDGEDSVWSKAAEFTRDREEEIRCLEEEIALIDKQTKFLVDSTGVIWARVRQRLQRELDRLKEGMK